MKQIKQMKVIGVCKNMSTKQEIVSDAALSVKMVELPQ